MNILKILPEVRIEELLSGWISRQAALWINHTAAAGSRLRGSAGPQAAALWITGSVDGLWPLRAYCVGRRPSWDWDKIPNGRTASWRCRARGCESIEAYGWEVGCESIDLRTSRGRSVFTSHQQACFMGQFLHNPYKYTLL